jgi:hypothetical protein
LWLQLTGTGEGNDLLRIHLLLLEQRRAPSNRISRVHRKHNGAQTRLGGRLRGGVEVRECATKGERHGGLGKRAGLRQQGGNRRLASLARIVLVAHCGDLVGCLGVLVVALCCRQCASLARRLLRSAFLLGLPQ